MIESKVNNEKQNVAFKALNSIGMNVFSVYFCVLLCKKFMAWLRTVGLFVAILIGIYFQYLNYIIYDLNGKHRQVGQVFIANGFKLFLQICCIDQNFYSSWKILWKNWDLQSNTSKQYWFWPLEIRVILPKGVQSNLFESFR